MRRFKVLVELVVELDAKDESIAANYETILDIATNRLSPDDINWGFVHYPNTNSSVKEAD